LHKSSSDTAISPVRSTWLRRFLTDYGMLLVLAALCLLFSLLTLSEQHPTGTAAAERLLRDIGEAIPDASSILIVGQANVEDSAFASILGERLKTEGYTLLPTLSGTPAAIRAGMAGLDSTGRPPDYVLTTDASAATIRMIALQFPGLEKTRILVPPPYKWPTFLLPDNIRNVANQITVIAIIAIGMTMVIITAGIDLSVGSMIALSAVVVAWLIGKGGGEQASALTMILAALGGILLCGGVGAFSGFMITGFRIPPFIATLAMMQVAAGLGYIVSQGKPIYQLPGSFVWLGRGVDPLLHIPNAVILMLILYAIAHIVMTRTTYGRYIYAVGGNPEAARLAGIRVKMVLFSVYAICGFLAGLGGVVMASQLKSGAPTYGLTYELYVIAAVVVGGTSLMGGEGRILGTLIGAFIIAVIQNGMNLVNVESYTQKVVLGLVILGAVLVDRLKQTRFNIKSSRQKAKKLRDKWNISKDHKGE
jgi:ribose transport system permease protein